MIERISRRSYKQLSYFLALDYLAQFQDSCSSTNLPALKNLQFSFCFPKEIEHKWRMNTLNCNRQWPFDDVHWYLDERWTPLGEDFMYMTKTFFILYRCPISVLLQHSRTLHNHHSALQISVPIRTSRRQYLKWTYDESITAEQIFDTLRVLVSGRLSKLTLKYHTEQVRTFNFIRVYQHLRVFLI